MAVATFTEFVGSAIFVTATQSLDARVPGTGTVLYSGNPPQVTTSITGSGTVIPG